MATYEGAWDCPHCGRVANRGPEKHCGGCGAARDSEVQFYLPEERREVTDELELRRAEAGPDWTCAYCSGDNSGSSAFCSNCGAGRDGARPRDVREHPIAQAVAPAAPRFAWLPWLKRGCLGCGGVTVLMIVLLVWLATPEDADLTVRSASWQRVLHTEENRQLHESAWKGEVPAGAIQERVHQEVHHVDHIQTGSETRTREVSERVKTGSRKVKTGHRDKGNGYFEDTYRDEPVYTTRTRQETYQQPIYRDRPVYRDKVDYSIRRWVPDQTLQAQGNDLKPVWPSFQPDPSHREGRREEHFFLQLTTSAGKACTFEAPDQSRWTSFKVGSTHHGKVLGDKCVELGTVTGE